jgi:predicted transcriptional regulator
MAIVLFMPIFAGKARNGGLHGMTGVTEPLRDVLARAQSWSEADQAKLVELAHEIEARQAGRYDATEGELAGIDRGLHAAEKGRFASEQQVEAVFRKHRRA